MEGALPRQRKAYKITKQRVMLARAIAASLLTSCQSLAICAALETRTRTLPPGWFDYKGNGL